MKKASTANGIQPANINEIVFFFLKNELQQKEIFFDYLHMQNKRIISHEYLSSILSNPLSPKRLYVLCE